MRLERLDSFARRHHGLITASAASDAGVSRSAWYRAIASGQFELLHPNVVRLWGSPDTFEQRALAGVWAAGRSALSSHRTAARLWRVDRPEDDPIEVLLDGRRHNTQPQGVIVHRPRDLVDLRPIMRAQIPTTNPLRMLLDLGAVDPDAVEGAMIDLIAARVVSPAAIQGALFRHARRGRNGITPYRAALESWLGEELPPDSKLEAEMARLIATHRLPPVQFHAIVIGFEVDFLVIGTNVVLECDGWSTHGLDRDQFEFDRMRDGELVAAGYQPVHFTWKMLTKTPDAVADRIRRAVDRWRPSALA